MTSTVLLSLLSLQYASLSAPTCTLWHSMLIAHAPPVTQSPTFTPPMFPPSVLHTCPCIAAISLLAHDECAPPLLPPYQTLRIFIITAPSATPSTSAQTTSQNGPHARSPLHSSPPFMVPHSGRCVPLRGFEQVSTASACVIPTFVEESLASAPALRLRRALGNCAGPCP